MARQVRGKRAQRITVVDPPPNETGVRLKPSARQTLKSIPRITGLAVATVSRALYDARDISAKTKRHIQAGADQDPLPPITYMFETRITAAVILNQIKPCAVRKRCQREALCRLNAIVTAFGLR